MDKQYTSHSWEDRTWFHQWLLCILITVRIRVPRALSKMTKTRTLHIQFHYCGLTRCLVVPNLLQCIHCFPSIQHKPQNMFRSLINSIVIIQIWLSPLVAISYLLVFKYELFSCIMVETRQDLYNSASVISSLHYWLLPLIYVFWKLH